MGFRLRLRRSARLGPRRFNDRYAGLRLFIDTPEAMEGHLLRAQGQDEPDAGPSAASRSCTR